MFKKGLAWFKEHPLAIVLVIGTVVLFVLISGGHASANTATGAPAAAPADNTLAIAQLSAQQNAQHDAASVAIATLGANAQMYSIDKGAQVAIYQTQAQEDLGLASLQSQVQVATLAADTNRMQIAATTDQAKITAHTYEAIAADNAMVAGYQTQRDIAQINAEQNVAIAQTAIAVDLEKVKQKEAEVQDYYNYKSGSRSGGGIGGLIGGILGSIF